MALLFHLARHRLPIAVAVVSGVLTIAGCGSSRGPGSASASAPAPIAASTSADTSTSAAARLKAGKKSPPSYARGQLAAAACIRSHGVPNFPDPTFGNGGIQVNLSTPPGMMTSPGFFLAEKDCAKLGLELAGYAPVSTATAAEMAEALTIAKCMRAHGVPHWPDPTKTLPSNLNGYGVQGAVPGPPGGPVFVVPDSINIAAPAVKQAAAACHDD